jgi:dipeptidyl aminopeptidase/acylaminoacyl peptidase
VRKQGTPVWYLIGLGEGHGFQKKSNADFQFYATLAFVERYLVGEAKP